MTTNFARTTLSTIAGALLLMPAIAAGATRTIPCDPSPSAIEVRYGDLVTCSLDARARRSYLFTGAEGERIIVTALSLGIGFPSVTVTDASGRKIGEGGGFLGARVDVSLPVGGVYTIELYEGYTGGPVSFSMLLDRIVPVSPSATRIAFGPLIKGTIDPAGDAKIFVANGAAGDTWSFIIRNGTRGVSALEMYGPLGETLAPAIGGFSGGQATVKLATTGPVTMRVFENYLRSAADFSLQLLCQGACLPDPPSPLITITTMSLGAASIHLPYGLNLTASGGTLPYAAWSVAHGELPPGMTLNARTGLLSGTPTAVGTWAFGIRVTDAKGLAATKNFGMVVNPSLITFKVGSNTSYFFSKLCHELCPAGLCGRGFNVVVVNELTGEPTDIRSFDTWFFDSKFADLQAFIESVPPNRILMVSVADESGLYRRSAGGLAVQAMFQRMGSQAIQTVGFRDSWIFVVKVGTPMPLADRVGRWITSAGWEPIGAEFVLELPANRVYPSAVPHVILQNRRTGAVGRAPFDGIGVTPASPFTPNSPSDVPDPDWRVIGVADFDGDRYADVVWQNRRLGIIEAWLMDGPQLRETRVLAATVESDLRVVGVGNFGSTTPSLLLRSDTTRQAQVWTFDDRLRFVARQPIADTVAPNSTVVGAADLNGDSKTDVILRNATTGAMEAWFMDGTHRSRVTPIPYAERNAAWELVAAVDLTGDARADFVWYDPVARKGEVWVMFGTQLWRTVPIQPLMLGADEAIVSAGAFNRAQSGAPSFCTYTISPGLATHPLTGGSGSVSVTTGSGCLWTAVSDASFTTITGGASGSGPGTVTYTVAPAATARSETLRIAGSSFLVTQKAPSSPGAGRDFDGDGKTDLAVFRSLNGTWYVRYSAQGYSGATADAFQWGLPGDVPLSGDFDGDGKIELTVFRPSNGTWYIRYSSLGYGLGTFTAFQWGVPDDIPLVGDFDGDGKTELTVWRPSTGVWYIRYSSLGYGLGSSQAFQWGLPGDVPIATDFDGDGKTELAVWRPSTGTWYIRYSTLAYGLSTYGTFQWGLPGDMPLGGDFDGDGKNDLTVWRPSNGTWYVRYSSLGYGLGSSGSFQWGLPGDNPISRDFDGDGKTELAVWRRSNGTWYIRYSSAAYDLGTHGTFQWGLPGDEMVR